MKNDANVKLIIKAYRIESYILAFDNIIAINLFRIADLIISIYGFAFIFSQIYFEAHEYMEVCLRIKMLIYDVIYY